MSAERKPVKLMRIEYHTARSSHYVCFKCRKQFKKPVDGLAYRSSNGKLLPAFSYDVGVRTYSCPQCGQPMKHVGKNFRPPSQNDIEMWEIARRLVAAGFNHSHTGGLDYPTKLKDVSDFLEKHRRLSQGGQLLKQWSKDQ